MPVQRVELTLQARAIEALKGLLCNPHIHLGDQGYTVRESEGKGWEGPSVKAWCRAVDLAEQVLAEVGIDPEAERKKAKEDLQRSQKLAQYEALKKELGL